MDTQQVTFMSKQGRKLAGVVTMPGKDKETYPVIILCHGFRGNKDHPVIANLASELALHGFMTLRFDFAGAGDSNGDYADIDIDEEADDLACAIDFVQNHQFVDTSQISIVGHSLGGMVAIIEAARNKDIKNLILLNPRIDRSKFPQKYEEKGTIKYYDDYFMIKNTKFNKRFLETGKKSVVDKAVDITQDLFVVVAGEDEECPREDAERFFEMAKSQKKEIAVIEGADHNFKNGETLEEMIKVVEGWLL